MEAATEESWPLGVGFAESLLERRGFVKMYGEEPDVVSRCMLP